MRFHMYLKERDGVSYKEQGRSKPISEEEAIKLIKTKCKAMMKYYSTEPDWGWFFRGVREGSAGFKHIDTTGEERVSKNSFNYYTLIINHSDPWKSFPLRNIIGTNRISKASLYSNNRTVYLMFPYDGQKIGICPQGDVWDSWYLFGERDASEINDVLYKLKITDGSWNSIVKSCGKFDKSDLNVKRDFMPNWFKTIFNDNYKGDMLKFLTDTVFIPKDFEAVKVGQKIPDNKSHELWTDGKCVMVNVGDYEKGMINAKKFLEKLK